MNKYLLLKALRLFINKLGYSEKYNLKFDSSSIEESSMLIQEELMSEKPTMIARFGAFELFTVVNYIGVNSTPSISRIYKFIKSDFPQWWWNEKLIGFMENNAGFFPSNTKNLSLFAEIMLKDMQILDILASWRSDERFVDNRYPKAKKIPLIHLESYLSSNPWTRVLEGKNVLVIHPFAELIEKQFYENRHNLFENESVLPDFKLQTIKAVQSIGGDSTDFKNWFEALEWMKKEIDKRNFDICLIGCGAYGFPLAAHCKRIGKKAVHMGGALQLLFGIKGKRWEDDNYAEQWGLPHDTYKVLFKNENWVRPGTVFSPKNYNSVEGGCYW